MYIFRIFVLTMITGCVSNYKLPSPSVNDLFERSSIRQSISLHDKNNNSYIPGTYDNVLYYLDMGMLNHYAGNYRLSNDLLSKAEMAIETNFTKSLSQYTTSLLLDDRTLNYYGEDYEDIYLNVFKALNFFKLKNIDAAGVEIRRVNEKLAVLQDKYSKLIHGFNHSKEAKKVKKTMKARRINFHNSALSRYLSSLYYCIEKKYDDARIDIQHIYEAFHQQQRMYNFEIPEQIMNQYECFSNNSPEKCLIPTNNAQIHVIAFAGRAPEKKEKTYWIVTQKNSIIIAKNKNGSGRMDVIPWPGIKSGYFFKFSVPYMSKRKNSVKRIVLIVDNQSVKLEKLEDMADIAVETFNQKKNLIYFKTFVRATLKGVVAATIKQLIEDKKFDKKTKKAKQLSFGESIWIELQKLLVDAAVQAIEHADLRISSFFPAEAYSGTIFVQPGSHHIKIIYYNHQDKPLKENDLGYQNISLDGLNLFPSSFYGIQ
ncbi:MAG: hypothetical protein HQK75_03870 [Candidatus Magnetomorum sp.]|nr:hypothetical protein [Candidatus Magnetomorum sp.]